MHRLTLTDLTNKKTLTAKDYVYADTHVDYFKDAICTMQFRSGHIFNLVEGRDPSKHEFLFDYENFGKIYFIVKDVQYSTPIQARETTIARILELLVQHAKSDMNIDIKKHVSCCVECPSFVREYLIRDKALADFVILTPTLVETYVKNDLDGFSFIMNRLVNHATKSNISSENNFK